MKKKLIFLSLATFIALVGYGTGTSQQSVANMNHLDMYHSSSSEVPKGLKEAENPAYAVGSQAFIQADHMPGMKGAVATIVGAFDTTAYAVSYTPNNRWTTRKKS